jgi:iron(III) transport system permease protein
MEGKATVSSTAARLTGWKGWGLTAAFAGIIGLAILPHISVILSSFTVDGAWYRSVLPTEWTTAHYEGMLQHPLAIGGIFNSLIYASLAMVACVVVGVAIAYLNARLRVKGGALLDTLAMLPLAVPGLVMAFGYVAMTVNFPLPQMRDFFNWIGANELASLLTVSGTAPNPILLLVVAYSIRRLPYVVRAASAGLEQTSGALEEAAQNLGANTLYTLRRVVVPLIAANLIAAAILVFSFSMLEVSDSLILTQSETDYPITKAIYVLFSRLGDGPYIASALGVWSMALLTVTLVGAGLIMGRKLGAIFRV